MIDTEISIFPEQRIVYATFGQRLGAYLLDSLILIIPTELISKLSGNHNMFLDMLHRNPISSASILTQLVTTLVIWIYFAGMESSISQATIGKQALSLKVTDLNGERISFANASGRYFAKFLSTIIILIGFFMVLWDDKRQGLHDKMAGTLVVNRCPNP